MKPIVIVGAGPAGLSCARRLAADGLPVVLIDDNNQAGGQYFKQLPHGYRALPNSKLLRDNARAQHLFSVLQHPCVTYLPGTTAWAAPQPLTIAYAGDTESGRIAAHAVVIATGAHEKPFPFPGWTTPGVISAGGCLNLAKGNGLVPSGRIVVAGNGPLVLVAAATLVAAGADVTHVYEAATGAQIAAAAAKAAWYSPSIFLKGLGYRSMLLRKGARFVAGSMIARARGAGQLESVDMAPVGPDGHPDLSKVTTLRVDTLVVGYGLLAGSDLIRLMGAQMISSPSLGGWVPKRSVQMETSIPNVYVAGDGAAIGGVEVATAEGELAAQAIIGRLRGRVSSVPLRYRKLDRFRIILSDAYRTKAPLIAADSETIICRCEQLRLSDLNSLAEPGDTDLARLKSSSRLGMGRCQGKNCLTTASLLFGMDRQHGQDEPFPRTRPPVRPVRLRDLIADKSIGPANPPDESSMSIDQESYS